jgi:hypothetical protein
MPGRDLARLALSAYERGVRLSLHTSRRAAEETVRLLGLDGAAQPAEPPDDLADGERARRSLRQRGEELLRRSADVNFDEEAHPAYIRILDDLSPDEARILRLLY